MQRKARKHISMMLALVMVFGLFAGMPLTALAAGGGTLTVNGTTFTSPGNDLSDVESAIQTLLDAGTDVTVTGSWTEADYRFGLDIPSGRTLTWNAVLSTIADHGKNWNDLVYLDGSGDFIVGAGAVLSIFDGDDVIHTDGPTVTVRGTVENTSEWVDDNGDWGTIYCWNASVIIDGGTVRANNGEFKAICIDSGTLDILSGTVSATSGTAIYSPGTVNISGGTVSATTGTAIEADTVNLSGGTVSATTGIAIEADTVNLSGGTVSATTGTAIEADIVNLSGGTISATTGIAIEAYEVCCDGTATVSNNGGANPAIIISDSLWSADSTDSDLTVNGNVKAIGEAWVWASFGKTTINGNIELGEDGGAGADNGGLLTVNGNVTSTEDGAYIDIYDGGTVTVNGNVSLAGDDSYIETEDNDCEINITGNVSLAGEDVYVGAYGGTISIGDDVSFTGGDSMVEAINGTVIVGGDVAFGDIAHVEAYGVGSTITIGGNVTFAGTVSYIQAEDGAKINITGSATATMAAPGNTLIACGDPGSEITVGNVSAKHLAAIDAWDGGKITVNGNVTNDGVGVYTETGGMVYITGTLTAAGDDMNVDDTIMTLGTPTMADELDGYYWDVYTDTTATPQSYVYLRKAAIPHTLTVTNGKGGGEFGVGTVVTITANAAPSGKTFDKWTTNNGGTFANAKSATTTFTMPANAVTVTATYKNTGSDGNGSGSGDTKYTVTFETNEGSKVDSQSIVSGEKATKPTNPTKEGYTFAGWYSDEALETKYDFDKGVTSNITLYAKWTESTEWQNPFSDVESDDWYYEDVNFVYENDIFKGTSETMFSPNAPMTRAMFVTALWRMVGSPAVDVSNQFSDVDEGAYYATAVQWAAENGIVEGIGGDLFAPHTEVTREQIAAIIYRYEQFSEKIPPDVTEDKNFVDSNTISDYAKTAVSLLVKQGIINGKDGNIFDPQGVATRAQVAAMLHRFMEATK